MFDANDTKMQESDDTVGRHRARRRRTIRRAIATTAVVSPALMLGFGGVANAEEPAEEGSEEAIAQAIEKADLSEIVGAVEDYVLAEEDYVGTVLIAVGETLLLEEG